MIVGADVACEVAARSLAAAGVGRLRWLGDCRGPELPSFAHALMASNPELELELAALAGDLDGAGDVAWREQLAGAAAVIRSGGAGPAMFPMLRASVRLGLPVVIMLPQADGVRVVSFRRHGPCPHVAFDRAFDEPFRVSGRRTAATTPSPAGDAGAVVAGQLAAAETLVVLSEATATTSRARAIHIPFDQTGFAQTGFAQTGFAQTGFAQTGFAQTGSARPDSQGGVPHAVDIPWTPECVACGGSGREMSLP